MTGEGASRRGADASPRSWAAGARALAVIALLATFPTPAAAEPADSPVLTARVFGVPVRLEVEPFAERARTRDALAAALEAIFRAQALTSPDPSALPFAPEITGGVADLNRAAGGPAVRVDADLFELLQRALGFCRWSEGALGPLGGHLTTLWGLRRQVLGKPTMAALEHATYSAACDRLTVDHEAGTVTLAAGSLVDLLPFERGFAADQAIEAFRDHGASNGWVEIGHLARAIGGGPSGDGWPIAVDATDPVTTPTERILLQDRALALAAAWAEPVEIAGDRHPRFLDQRSGRPGTGTVAVVAVTETAVDAAGLAAVLFVLPSRVGEYRLGALRPTPAVKWFLGTGEGLPLIVERGWADLPKWRADGPFGLPRRP
ncbi:MAG TPA: FAD:protein FMN transferase [Thermoanaerobaculia bacterium]|nr:FAD:protein FMN transferase [Thermoanaerobaculia bacterium]